MKKRLLYLSAVAALMSCHLTGTAQTRQWPEQTPTTKAGSRWWWLGSAVDKENLRANLREYAKTGIGSLEITPIYGVKGNESRELQFLSQPWMEALKFTEEEGKHNGILIDMNAGTGWPFGGPNVPLDEAACKAVIVDTVLTGSSFKDIDIAAPEKERKYSTLQKVMAFKQCSVFSVQCSESSAQCSAGKEKREAIDITEYVKDGKLNWTPQLNTKHSTLNTKKSLNTESSRWRIIALYIGRTRQKVKRAAPGGEGYVIDHFDR
ncbi:MAG: hypothetical protein J6C66_05930, partial [Prevotella sp.]|nr:hypothetical protein [Prevotella sp.]